MQTKKSRKPVNTLSWTEKSIIKTQNTLQMSEISARCFLFVGNISATICKND